MERFATLAATGGIEIRTKGPREIRTKGPRDMLVTSITVDPVELDAIFLARTGTKESLTPVTQPKGCHL